MSAVQKKKIKERVVIKKNNVVLSKMQKKTEEEKKAVCCRIISLNPTQQNTHYITLQLYTYVRFLLSSLSL
jgi:hypothetical protein